MKPFLRIVVRAAGLWLERNAVIHAGSLAFYRLFSVAPVVIIAVSIAGSVFGQEAARGAIVGRLDDFHRHRRRQAVEVLSPARGRKRPDSGRPSQGVRRQAALNRRSHADRAPDPVAGDRRDHRVHSAGVAHVERRVARVRHLRQQLSADT